MNSLLEAAGSAAGDRGVAWLSEESVATDPLVQEVAAMRRSTYETCVIFAETIGVVPDVLVAAATTPRNEQSYVGSANVTPVTAWAVGPVTRLPATRAAAMPRREIQEVAVRMVRVVRFMG
jgi:hypothetical protein